MRFVEWLLPNEEVRSVLREKADTLLRVLTQKTSTPELANAFFTGDIDFAQETINHFLQRTISVRDYDEAFYHGTLTELLNLDGKRFTLHSNYETGEGYADIIAEDEARKLCFVIEVKRGDPSRITSKKENRLEQRRKIFCEALDRGEAQIKDRYYVEGVLQNEDYRCRGYVIAFYGKECRIRCVDV